MILDYRRSGLTGMFSGMLWIGCVASLLLLTAACTNRESLGIEIPEDFKPHRLLIDPDIVEKKKNADPDGIARNCPQNFTAAEIDVIHGFPLTASGDFAGWYRKDRYIRALTEASLVYLVTTDESAATYVANLLAKFASADAFQYVNSSSTAPTYADTYPLKNVAIPTLAAWDAVRNSPSISDRQRQTIEDWLGGLLRRVDVANGRSANVKSNRNNQRYLRDTVIIQWGLLTGSRSHFVRGVDGVLAALGQMRNDGSLPFETDRGDRATHYMNHSTASLVTSAELALQAGVDLYAVKVNGRSLHDIVRFTLDAIKNPMVMRKYVKKGQRLSKWNREWIATYAARFGDTETGKLAREIAPPLSAGEPYDNGLVSMMGRCLAFLKH